MSLSRLRPVVVVSMAGTAAAAWAVVTRAAGVHLVVQFPHAHPSSVGLAAVVGAAAAAGVVGWAFLAFLEARATRPRRTWVRAAAAASVASLALPGAFASGWSATMGLVAIHLAVAAVAIFGFTRTVSIRPDRTTPDQGSNGSSPGWFPSERAESARVGSRMSGLRARLSSTPKLVMVIAAAGLMVAAFAGVAAAGVIKPPAFRRGGLPFGPPFLTAGTPDGTWPGGWSGGRPGSWSDGWPGHTSTDTEYFDVASTTSSGPGAIVLAGPLDEGGREHPGRSIDDATFANGSFRIDHSAGRPTVRFDRSTCVGTITQVGPFEVIDATGPFTVLQGHQGTYHFDVTYATGRDAEGCTSETTAFIESIHGVMAVGTPGAARLSAALSS